MHIKEEPSRDVLLSMFEDAGDTVRWKVTRCWKAPAGTEVRYATGGYYSVMLAGQRWYVHRLLWVMRNGPIPQGMRVDHRDGNPFNNQPDNPRLATGPENAWNAGTSADNRTGCKGVSLHKRSGKWRADVQQNGVQVYLGLFSDKSAAARAVQIARESLHGDFANHGACV